MKHFALVFNLVLILSAFFVDNEFLCYNGYIIYLLQFCVNLFVFVKVLKIRLLHLFLPSFFSYLFISVNLILGGYLVPRGFGFFDKYSIDILKIDDYRLFVPYILFSSLILYLLSFNYIEKSDKIRTIDLKFFQTNYIAFFLYIASLFLGLPVAFQLGFLIVFLYGLDKKNKIVKFGFYLIMLILSLKFYSFDKRNIIVVLFLILFFEAKQSEKYLKFKLISLFKLLMIPIVFLFLIITASINRGYGDFEDKTLKNSLSNSLDYISSDFFIDAITDNLELSYNYGATFMAMDYVEKGIIDYQYGLTLIKPLFILIPRELYPNKPYSFMHLYTREYMYNDWKEGSSLPVIFPAELYGNFHYFGLIILFMFYSFLNNMYIFILENKKMTFKLFTSIFFVITHLFFIRGGGIDLYVLYFLFSIPTYFISKITFKIIKINE